MKRIVRASLGTWMRRAVVCGAALGVVGAGMAPVAHAADEAHVEADVQCTATGEGVLDLTLINDSAMPALFVVVQPAAGDTPDVLVDPGDAYAITFTGLADGWVTVIMAIDGVEEQVSAEVVCALAQVQSGAAHGQSGVAGDFELPRTGSSPVGVALAGVLVAGGAAITMLARRRPA